MASVLKRSDEMLNKLRLSSLFPEMEVRPRNCSDVSVPGVFREKGAQIDAVGASTVEMRVAGSLN